MEFKKYQHVEKFGTTETEAIDIGTCYIFPKIDGTNASVWLTDKGQMGCGSRKRQLALDNDNAGFMNWAVKQDNLRQFILDHPNMRLYGEWLVPHTVKYYRDDAWKHFYVFDVYNDASGVYVHYEKYKELLDQYNIEYVPPIAVINNPTHEKLIGFLDRNYYLISDGEKPGEGIVIKNYQWKNKFGRQTWAKIVRNEFKDNFHKQKPQEVKEKKLVEEDIVSEFVTKALIEKEYAKIENESGWTSKMIPRLLNTVFYCLVKEESWNYVKKFKNPTIDYKRLQYFTFNKVKEVKPELF
jgi:hypothetical protein